MHDDFALAERLRKHAATVAWQDRAEIGADLATAADRLGSLAIEVEVGRRFRDEVGKRIEAVARENEELRARLDEMHVLHGDPDQKGAPGGILKAKAKPCVPARPPVDATVRFPDHDSYRPDAPPDAWEC